MAQDNAWPFTYTGGSKVGIINWTGPAQMKFAAYWQKLLSAKEVNGTTDVSATSFADMDKGIDASWLSSAGARPISRRTPSSRSATGAPRRSRSGRPAAHVAANWGGSTYPVFSQSANKAGPARRPRGGEGEAQ